MYKLVNPDFGKNAESLFASAKHVGLESQCGIPDKVAPGEIKADWSVEFKQEV